ncbi:MAG: PRC-barrel domain-containing protein [Candidatus Aenigmarchaeota archaeon]|nr:PRC-barrel domain-containing protein [Candidatus Aenigmarchaeota archaeon]
MAINVQSLSDMIEKDVFTSKGSYGGRVADITVDLDRFRIKSLVVDAVKGSFLSKFVGSKKGVIIPFQMIQTIGDVVIIKHVSPVMTEGEELPNMAEDESA